MTDLLAAPGSDAPSVGPDNASTVAVEWQPNEQPPVKKKRRVALWVGIGAGALLIAAGAASTVLIAPGTTVAGVNVGGMTPGMAADAISAHLANTQVTLEGVSGSPVLSGADLGASVDARTLADSAFADHPMWNVTGWMPEPITTDVVIDRGVAESALRAAAPGNYTEPVNAAVTFDAASKTYVTTADVPGTGIDLDALTASLTAALADQKSEVTFNAGATETSAELTQANATTFADSLNTMLGTVGFYVGEERTVPIAPEVAASWLTISDADGQYAVTADTDAIQSAVAGLPEQINREAINATVITNSAGKVLKAITEGQTGRTVGDTASVASAFGAQLADLNGVFALNVTETEFTTTTLFRRVEVNLTEQRTYIYENEKLVNSWSISSGLPGHDTDPGHFTVYAQLRTQNMGDPNLETVDYYTPDVPYVTYYNGDEALHGAYWHNNFGNRMSHGCVNMPVGAAQEVFNFATIGTEVWVHY